MRYVLLKQVEIPSSFVIFAFCLVALIVFRKYFKIKDNPDDAGFNKEELILALNI